MQHDQDDLGYMLSQSNAHKPCTISLCPIPLCIRIGTVLGSTPVLETFIKVYDHCTLYTPYTKISTYNLTALPVVLWLLCWITVQGWIDSHRRKKDHTAFQNK